jgi:hypothetical protein
VGVVARRLAGAALVRLSGAVQQDSRRKDVLGVALRLRSGADVTDPQARRGDQDLLLASFRRLWTLPVGVWTTQQHDFLANDYYGVSPFEVDGYGRVEFRLVTPRPGTPGRDRLERLERDVQARRAEFLLEMRPLGTKMARRWIPVVRVRLVESVELDQEALRFSPFWDGRGIHPYGFIHALRRATYASSQIGRQLAERAEARRHALRGVTSGTT